MDRNVSTYVAVVPPKVALRKESVDRNIRGNPYLQIGRQSLSARRAWIEIAIGDLLIFYGLRVALRKESVDRNARVSSLAIRSCGSLSARRAWIEMLGPACPGSMQSCRSPQGERG